METNEEIDQVLSTNDVEEHQHDALVSSFLEIAVGQTVEIARNYLHTTNWNLEEAINLFCMMNDNNQLVDDGLFEDQLSDDSFEDQLSDGSFEEAKFESMEENLWLIVNLQSKTELASDALNRDLWFDDDAFCETLAPSFNLWHVYDHTIEGQKISTFYKIDSVRPVVFVIDPITGEKMHMWSGVIEKESFLEDLKQFMDAGPHQRIASLIRNRNPQTEETCHSRTNNTDQVVVPSWGEEFEKVDETCWTNNNTDQVVVSPSILGKEFEKKDVCLSSYDTEYIVEPFWSQECVEFPVLTEEPKGDSDQSLVCSVCIRFPDGRRKKRRFLKTEPIQLLWSFCDSHMEASEKKLFELVYAIPGASKTLDYEANETFDQSGLANSMISVTWL